MSLMHRRVWRLPLTAGLAAVCLALVAGTDARAGFTILLDSTTPSGANTTFNFSASIAPDDSIVSGNFFRVYDFNGYVGGTAVAPAGWTTSIANSNPTPPPSVLLTHGDDPALPNVTYTYTGAVPIVGPTTITGFSADSIYGLSTTIKDFVGQDTKATGPQAGSLVDSRGDIAVPGPAVPEPSGLITMSLGTILFGAVFAYRNRRKPAI